MTTFLLRKLPQYEMVYNIEMAGHDIRCVGGDDWGAGGEGAQRIV
jgi:hypothetical protein